MTNTKHPRFEQRHFEAIAELIASMPQSVAERVVDALVPFFKADNPKFLPHRFREACKVESKLV